METVSEKDGLERIRHGKSIWMRARRHCTLYNAFSTSQESVQISQYSIDLSKN
jgi:hypothetical protein